MCCKPSIRTSSLINWESPCGTPCQKEIILLVEGNFAHASDPSVISPLKATAPWSPAKSYTCVSGKSSRGATGEASKPIVAKFMANSWGSGEQTSSTDDSVEEPLLPDAWYRPKKKQKHPSQKTQRENHPIPSNKKASLRAFYGVIYYLQLPRLRNICWWGGWKVVRVIFHFQRISSSGHLTLAERFLNSLDAQQEKQTPRHTRRNMNESEHIYMIFQKGIPS